MTAKAADSLTVNILQAAGARYSEWSPQAVCLIERMSDDEINELHRAAYELEELKARLAGIGEEISAGSPFLRLAVQTMIWEAVFGEWLAELSPATP